VQGNALPPPAEGADGVWGAKRPPKKGGQYRHGTFETTDFFERQNIFAQSKHM